LALPECRHTSTRKQSISPSIDRTKLFRQLDDFAKATENQKLLANPERQRNQPCGLCVSEVMTILALFHFSHFRTFKRFRLFRLQIQLQYYRTDFPGLPSYTRFVDRLRPLTALCAFLLSHMGEATGAAFIDSTRLEVCAPHRIHSHRVFRGVAQRGETSTGWFFGFKPHLIVNDRGELLAVKFTAGNVDDRKPVADMAGLSH
jgi:hypothetical protein